MNVSVVNIAIAESSAALPAKPAAGGPENIFGIANDIENNISEAKPAMMVSILGEADENFQFEIWNITGVKKQTTNIIAAAAI